MKKLNVVSQLAKLVPPPVTPVDSLQESMWDGVQKDLGTQLPEDLKELNTIYGSGRFEDPSGFFSFYVYNVFARRYKRDVEINQKALRYNAKSWKIFPQTPGLLACGVDDNRRQLCWLSDGDPNDWPVVFISNDGKLFEYDLSLSGFLLQLFTGNMDDWGGEMPATWFGERRGEFFFKPAKPYDPSKWHPPLLEAVLMLDRQKVRQLLHEGDDPNVTRNGATPLFAAIENVYDDELVEILLSAGADPNVQDDEGRILLNIAAASDYAPKSLELLLAAGANVSMKDDRGWSAFHSACKRKFEDRVRLLLAYGADPNDRLPNGETPIQLARLSPSICQMLKAAGANE